MTLTVPEAEDLVKVVEKSGKTFGLMHNYTGYPMVKLARDMVKKGDLGQVRKVVVCYPQGWLARPIEKSGQMQASWRTDPKQSGAAGLHRRHRHPLREPRRVRHRLAHHRRFARI